MRFAIYAAALLACACGKILDETDGGDAATGDGGANDGGGEGFFPCGEPGYYVNCASTTQYCLLVRSSHARTYSCELTDGEPPTCAGYPAAAAPYDCGCYVGSNGEVTITVCQ